MVIREYTGLTLIFPVIGPENMHHPHNIIIGFRIQTLHSQVIYLFPRCVLFPCFYFEFFFFIFVRTVSIDRRKTETKVIATPNHNKRKRYR